MVRFTASCLKFPLRQDQVRISHLKFVTTKEVIYQPNADPIFLHLIFTMNYA